ncbi:hypothetical protein F5Y17DRAFT_474739 [Xylariaceae sp. FL0594]|nr:hypothetical protein F5Y17DRAFT_474739 [Xylariaceae sp. FL0594]
MAANISEMEGSPGMETNIGLYALHSDESQFSLQLSQQFAPFSEPQFQPTGSRPLYHPDITPVHIADSSCCLFRCEIPDDCAKARFYAGMLEFYLLDNKNQGAFVSCPMASCPSLYFEHPKDMLRHLKNCKFFDKGKTWCPTCQRFEYFNIRSSRKCSWDKDHNIGRKILQKYKDVFRGLGAGHTGAHEPYPCADLCAACSSPLAISSPSSTHNSHTRSLSQSSASSISVARQSHICNEPVSKTNHPHRYELDSPPGGPTELPGETPQLGLPTAGGGILLTAQGHDFTQEFPHVGQSSTFGHIGVSGQVAESQASRNTYNNEIGCLVHLQAAGAPISQQLTGSSKPAPPLGKSFSNQGVIPWLTVDTRLGLRRATDPYLSSEAMYDLGDIVTGARTAFPTARTNSAEQAQSTCMAGDVPEGRQVQWTLPFDSGTFLEPATPVLERPQSSYPASPASTLVSPFSTWEEGLKCDECGFRPKGKPESHMAYLRKHRKAKHQENPKLTCDKCGKTFTRLDNMTKHMKRKHKVHELASFAKRQRPGSADNQQSLNLLPEPRKKRRIYNRTWPSKTKESG